MATTLLQSSAYESVSLNRVTNNDNPNINSQAENSSEVIK